MVQSHDPPWPESGQDKKYYEHVMKDSVGQTSQYSDNGINTPTSTTISWMQISALPITTTPAHEYQAQTVVGVFKVVLPVRMNIQDRGSITRICCSLMVFDLQVCRLMVCRTHQHVANVWINYWFAVKLWMR
jgi:hypothetical protein